MSKLLKIAENVLFPWFPHFFEGFLHSASWDTPCILLASHDNSFLNSWLVLVWACDDAPVFASIGMDHLASTAPVWVGRDFVVAVFLYGILCNRIAKERSASVSKKRLTGHFRAIVHKRFFNSAVIASE